MATKLGSMVTYPEGLLVIKSHNPLSRGFVESHDKPKSYIHHHSA